MPTKLWVGGFFLTCCCMSPIDLPLVLPTVTAGDRAVDHIERKTKAYAWAATGLVYSACALAVEQLGERGARAVLQYLPGNNCCVAPTVGITGSLVLTSLLFVKYREIMWYAHAVLFSGKRLSPYIAHEILHDLRSYVRYLDALKNMQVEMELLLAEVNNRKLFCLSAGELAKKIHQVVENGEIYVRNVCRRLEELGLYREEGGALFSQEATQQDFDELRTADFIGQSLELDTEVFDHLVTDLFAYWQGYLEGLMAHIEDKMVVCQRLLSFERTLVNIFKQPLQMPSVENETL